MNDVQKPYAESCDENALPILAVLKTRLPLQGSLLEIGSGTGQHAIRFAQEFPQLTWQTSDRAAMHEGIRQWLSEVQHPNLPEPLALDVLRDPCPSQTYDAVFSANTAHIMSTEAVEAMFACIAKVLKPESLFLLYGPFMYDGRHISESNLRFDSWLRTREAQQGVRDVTWLEQIAKPLGLVLEEDIEMPVNNRILVWRRLTKQTV